MSYSIIGTLAFILNLIINRETLWNVRDTTKAQSFALNTGQKFINPYRQFLIVSNLYFLVDMGWGLLYEHHHIDSLFPILYCDCILYFLLMFTTMLTWMRSIVAYLNKHRRRSKILLFSVWSMFLLGLTYLIINCFKPFIFSFNEKHEYITEPGRHIAFILQIVLYMVATIYMFYIARKSSSIERIRYRAVGFTCLVMDFFLVLQIFDPRYPSYATGLIIGICVIHSFVESGERKQKEIYDNIARSLAENYDVIYYVDAENSNYTSYECRNIYGDLDMQKSGSDFFADSRVDISNIVNKSDMELVLAFVNKDHLISSLTNKRSCSLDYRVSAFKKTHYVRMTVRKTMDTSHFIFGIENIDEEVKKEKQHLKALNTEKELARRDELTGIKNKTAYNELEKSVQDNIDSGMDYLSFALVVCDTNNLKKINDTQGHVAGDEYIKKSAMLLCNTFVHSPVFRVGGDEFVVFLRGSDYLNREVLMKKLRAHVRKNLKSKSGPILASGISDFNTESDRKVSQIFDRADKDMYNNKRALKKEESQLQPN